MGVFMYNELKLKYELLKIYKEIYFNKNLGSEEIENLYIEYLKTMVCLTPKKPVYDDYSKKYEYINCYGYALGLTYPKIFHDRYEEIEMDDFSHNLGFIYGKRNYSNLPSFQLDALYNDLDALNIEYYDTEIDAKNTHGGYKITFYLAVDDFHFMRQNRDGSWSEKIGYTDEFYKNNDALPHYKKYELQKTLEIVKPRKR